MNRLRKLLLKKEEGTVGLYLIVMVLFLLIIFIAGYEICFQRTVHLKKKVDNGIILSVLSANVIDLYQYASTGDIAYATSYQTGTNSNLYVDQNGQPYTGYNDVISGNKKAGSVALDRFLESFGENLSFIDYTHALSLNDNTIIPVSSNDTLVKSARIDEFILYNKVGGKIYKSRKENGGDFSVTELTGNSDPSISKVTNIQNSCIYVKMTFEFHVLGDICVTFPFDEIVSISAT